MKRTLAILAACVALVGYIENPAHAQSITTTTGSQSQSGAYSGVNIQQQAGKRAASSAIAPGLIAGGITCTGSISMGGAAAGWGTSFGMTFPDRACNTREDAKYMLLISNNKLAAKERLCDNNRIRSAYAAAGDPCIRDRGRVQRVAYSRRAQLQAKQDNR